MRVALRIAAVAAGAALAIHASAHAPDADAVRVAAGAGLALVVLAASVDAGWASWAGAAVLGTAYVIALIAGHADLEPAAPMAGVSLYLVVELLDVAAAEPCAPKVRSMRTFHAAGVACVAAVVGAGLMVLGAASTTAGTAAVVATAACGCVLFAALASAAARS